MTDSYLPARDAQALVWMQTFANGIAANPAMYQVSAADAANIGATVAGFAAAFAVASDPAQRTKVAVAAKDAARVVAEELCRRFVVLIKYHAGITDADKIAIGVRPVNTSREPIPAPNSSPLLNIIGATPGAHTVRYSDTNTPDSGKKPFGAVSLLLFVAVGMEPAADPEAAQFYGAFTKNPIGVAFDAADDGKVATYFARWVSRRGEVGPWSLPVRMRVAG